MNELIKGKNALLAFSDPAGGKAVLAFADLNRNAFKSIRAVSDRVYDFYPAFGFDIEAYAAKPPGKWLEAVQADVLITGTSVPHSLEIPLISAARQSGLLSMSFVDHWTNMAKRFQTVDSLVLPDWICVVDE